LASTVVSPADGEPSSAKVSSGDWLYQVFTVDYPTTTWSAGILPASCSQNDRESLSMSPHWRFSASAAFELWILKMSVIWS
jgi:hypothetical protein